jgi:hypothetical protein
MSVPMVAPMPRKDEALSHKSAMEVYQVQMSKLNSRQVKAARLCAMQRMEPVSNYSYMKSTVVLGGTFFGDMFGDNTIINMTPQEQQARGAELRTQQQMSDKFRDVLQQLHFHREMAKAALRPRVRGGESPSGRWSRQGMVMVQRKR